MATTSRTELYEEIDLRPYIEALLRSWMWIVGAAVAVAITTFFLTSLGTPLYQATALVAVTKPRFSVQLDPRLQTIEDLGVAYGAYQEIALSDELVSELYASLELGSENIMNLQSFKSLLNANVGTNQTLIELSVTTTNPNTAAEIANRWAELVIERSNELYGNFGDESVTFLENQLSLAEADLRTAESNLIEFTARDQKGILENEVAVLINEQKIYLETQTNVEALAWSVTAFRDSLARLNENTPLSKADQLTALSLQARVFDAQLDNLQIDASVSENLLASNRVELIESLDNLILILEERIQRFDQLVVDLSPIILEKQEMIGELQIERDRLEAELEHVRDTTTLLSRSIEEATISSQDVGNQIRLAGKAVALERPLSNGRITTTLIAFALVSAASAAWIFAREWWYRNPNPSST